MKDQADTLTLLPHNLLRVRGHGVRVGVPAKLAEP